MTTTADLILHEYHRRLTHIDKRQPDPRSLVGVQLHGELIGLRGALGIALGGQVQGGEADRLAAARYAELRDSALSSTTSCTCCLCTGMDVT